jgi:response regulator of citrate/malate metabolism
MIQPNAITPNALERILGFLAQFFISAAQGDTAAARTVASDLLASYGARTNKEVRLAALNIAFSFGALDSLSRSVAADLSVTQLLRLRSNANALNRAACKTQEALDRLQQAAPRPEPAETPDDLPASAETLDLVAFARPAPMSRQQRRAAERKAEKARLRQLEAARRAERAAARGLLQHIA